MGFLVYSAPLASRRGHPWGLWDLGDILDSTIGCSMEVSNTKFFLMDQVRMCIEMHSNNLLFVGVA